MTEHFLQLSRRLRFIDRLSTNPMQHRINDAEHSFSASVIAYSMIEEYRSSNRMTDAECYHTLSKVLIHDVHEAITGDVLYSTKRYNEAINTHIAELEESIDSKLFPNVELQRVSDRFNILKAADMAELLMTVSEEIQFGNQFPNIYQIWLFCHVVVHRFNVKFPSQTLQWILNETYHPSKGSTMLAVLAEELNLPLESEILRYCRADTGSDYEACESHNYEGYRGYLFTADTKSMEVINVVEKDKEVSWFVLVSIGKSRYVVGKRMSNFSSGCNAYHVDGPRSIKLESVATKVHCDK